MMSADKVAAMVAWLAHRDCTAQATIHEAGAGESHHHTVCVFLLTLISVENHENINGHCYSSIAAACSSTNYHTIPYEFPYLAPSTLSGFFSQLRWARSEPLFVTVGELARCFGSCPHSAEFPSTISFLVGYHRVQPRGLVWYGTVWYGMVWYGMLWCGVEWCGVV